jgi:hypothetical protein
MRSDEQKIQLLKMSISLHRNTLIVFGLANSVALHLNFLALSTPCTTGNVTRPLMFRRGIAANQKHAKAQEQ